MINFVGGISIFNTQEVVIEGDVVGQNYSIVLNRKPLYDVTVIATPLVLRLPANSWHRCVLTHDLTHMFLSYQ